MEVPSFIALDKAMEIPIDYININSVDAFIQRGSSAALND